VSAPLDPLAAIAEIDALAATEGLIAELGGPF
jgi:hypothetical protein